jgi:isoquinoline 1-oxidoreductase beta subunit
MNARIDLTRRRLLQGAATGLVLAFFVPARQSRAQEQSAPPAPKLPRPNAFVRIAPDDSVTVQLSHAEMGQGIWTALPMLLAEELECDWSKVRVEHAPAAPEYAHALFGMQMTGGSSSTYSEFDRYRTVGAMARTMLVQAAATRANVPVAECRVENGVVIAGTKRLRYGEVADDAAKLKAPETVALKDRKDWRLIGKPTRRIDSAVKVNGAAQFGIDVHFEGLKTATVARGPVFGATVKSFDATAAKAVKGVVAVVQVPSGIAVIADHFWAAKTGRDALKIDWDLGAQAKLDSTALRDQFRTLAGTPGAKVVSSGDTTAAFKANAPVVDADYEVPYLAHAAMEPLNCTVRLSADKCEIWSGTQFQGVDQQVAAKITGLKPEQIEIHTTFLGGGFGRRANPHSDFIAEAVEVAKATKLPVKVIWTREDDTRGGYYRPAYIHRVRASLASDGAITGFSNTIVGQSILVGSIFEAMMVKDGVDATSVEGVSDSPYLKAMAAYDVSLHSPKTGIPVLWWRSVGHTHTAFVMESVVDELAHAAKQDPLAFRRKLLQRADAKRHLGVLDRAAKEFGWDKALPRGHGKGIAVHESFGSYVAQAAEVSVENGVVRVHRVVCAVDCGLFVNPMTIEAQVQGAVAFGLGAALHGKITFADGRVQQSNYHDYLSLRLSEMPKVDVHIVDSGEKPGGIGEPGTPPIAPAVANAIFAATGQRLRTLPFALAKA